MGWNGSFMETTTCLMDTSGDIIRRYRELRGLSRAALASRVGMSEPSIEGYEMKGARPGRPVAVRLDEELGANGAILAACDYNTGPDDWGAEISRLRDEVERLNATVRALAIEVQRLLER